MFSVIIPRAWFRKLYFKFLGVGVGPIIGRKMHKNMKMVPLRPFSWNLLLSLVLIEVAMAKSCSDPEVPKDGWRSSPAKHVFAPHETVHYYCKENYTLSGAPKVRCLPEGRWDRKPPTCLDPCGGCSAGGMCIYRDMTKKFTCFCKAGYRGEKCRTPYCLKPNPVANGGYFITAVPKGRDNYDIGTELMFHCNMGYKISGKNSNIKCNLVDGKALWSQTFPTCQRKRCSNPLANQLLTNGDYNPRSGTYAIDDIVSFTCNAGFELHGASTVRCHLSGLWSSVSWPRCASKVCPSPPVLPHGRVILTSKRCSAGTTISYACVRGQGYYLFGPKSQTCVANANGDMIWTPKRPECITRLQFEQLCALQNKVMTFDPRPGCVLKIAVDGGQATTKRNPSLNTLTIVTGTAGGLLGLLLVIIAFVICQRRRLVRRMRLATSRRARTAEDERMLIYYSNDYHFFLPSYDEAMRARPTEPPPFEEAVNSQNDNQNAQSEEDTTAVAIEEPQVAETQATDEENEYETIERFMASTPDELIYSTVERYTARPSNDAEDSAGVGEANLVVNPIANVDSDSGSDQPSASDENTPLV